MLRALMQASHTYSGGSRHDVSSTGAELSGADPIQLQTVKKNPLTAPPKIFHSCSAPFTCSGAYVYYISLLPYLSILISINCIPYSWMKVINKFENCSDYGAKLEGKAPTVITAHFEEDINVYTKFMVIHLMVVRILNSKTHVYLIVVLDIRGYHKSLSCQSICRCIFYFK